MLNDRRKCSGRLVFHTETTYTDGEFGTTYRSFRYNSACTDSTCCLPNAGNDLVEEIDARGNKTQYIVDPETSRNTCVIDRCGNRTAYAYDEAGRTTQVTSQDVNGTDIAHVSYAYDAFNNLTEITRGDGMKYALTYNAFHNLQSIGVQGTGTDLVTYTYKNGNGRLKEVTYANGHTMKATYNSFGQLSVEKWQNASNALVAHYKYVYDGQGNIVRSIDMTAQKEYDYIYDEGKIASASAYGVTINEQEIITGKNCRIPSAIVTTRTAI